MPSMGTGASQSSTPVPVLASIPAPPLFRRFEPKRIGGRPSPVFIHQIKVRLTIALALC